jgi:hypothetical protein
MTRQHRTIVLGSAIMLCAAVGCGTKSGGTSRLSTSVGGRKILAVIDGPAFIRAENDKATVSFAAHKIVVDKLQVLLDAAVVCKIPVAAKDVQVVVNAGELKVSVDGSEIAAAPVP